MNTTNTLRAIDVDLNYLAHYNTKGSHWYVNGPGKRYQAHAQYAMGKANPDAKERKSSDRTTKSDIKSGARSKPMYYSAPDKSLGDRVKGALTDAKAKRQAKADAAVAAALKDSGSRGAQRLESRNMLARIGAGAAAAGLTYAGAKAGAAGGSALKENMANNAKPSAVNQYGVSAYGGKMPGNMKPNAYGASSYATPRARSTELMNRAVSTKNGSMVKSLDTTGKIGRAVSGAAGAVGNTMKNLGGTKFGQFMTSPGGFALSSAVGGFAGARLGSMGHYAAAYNGYMKRGQGTLRGSKVSKQYKDTYKKTYAKYLNEYSKKAKSGLTYGSTKALRKYND